MIKKLIFFTIMGLLLALIMGSDPRAVAIHIMRLMPRPVAVKLIQGLKTVHSIGPAEIDHRFGRFRAASEQMNIKENLANESLAVDVKKVGAGYWGSNPRGDFGTLLGYSVAMGGDVDGNKGDEFIAGGYEYSDFYIERGMVSLVSNGGRDVRIYGPRQHYAWFGHSVANNGDFDGDGLADILVGARFAYHRAGAAYLIPGESLASVGDSVDVEDLDGVIEFTMDESEAELGFEVYFGGDWDGDGKSELVMRAHIDGRQGGGVFVVFSSLVRSNAIDLSEDDASIAIAIDQEYADIGRTIVTVDDMDGDGAEELVLGSQAASSYFGQDQYVPSRLYMVFSNDIRPGRNVGIDDILLVSEESRGDNFGSCVGRLDDINGDGVADFLVGARHAQHRRGAVYVVSGKAVRDRLVSGGEIAISEVHLKKLVGEEEGDLLGWSCAEHSGDFDGDGIGDIAIGARQADGYAVESGAVYVLFSSQLGGSPKSEEVSQLVASKRALKIAGNQRGQRFGSKRRFAAGGDFNGDGIPDMAVGSPGTHEGGIYAGAVWAIDGHLLSEQIESSDGKE